VKVILVLVPFIIALFILARGFIGLPGALGNSGDGVGPTVVAALGLGFQIFTGFVLGLVYARCSMVFPATAIDNHMGFSQGWDFTKGNAWRLLSIFVCSAIPIWLVTSPISVGVGELAILLGNYGSVSGTLSVALINQILAFLALAIGIYAISIPYTHLILSSAAEE